MKKLIGIAMAALFSLPSTFLIASPAQAAGKARKDGVSLYFNASPEPVKKCGTVNLRARVHDPAADEQAFNVSFMFKRAGSTRWVIKKIISTSYSGHASTKAKQCRSGTWAAVAGVGDWAGPRVHDKVKVR